MAYREDNGLVFLAECSDEDLHNLVYCLTYDKDDKKLSTEELTGNDKYKEYYPRHSMYWQEIAAELQCFGGNTIMTLFRGGKGVLYEEVLSDVCEKLIKGFKKPSQINIEELEKQLLMSLLQTSIEQMSFEELKMLAKDLKVDNLNLLTAQNFLLLAQTIFKAGGFKSYQLTLIIANAVSRAIFAKGLTFAGNAALTRVAGVLAGPIGITLSGIWTIIDLAGPAYRVTIPAVIQVTLLRQRQKLSLAEYEEAINQALDIDSL